MEFTKTQMDITKGVAILFMLFLHLFNRTSIEGYYDVFFRIKGVPLVYYMSFIADACVPIYCFCSGYGLFLSYKKTSRKVFLNKNLFRILKLFINLWIVMLVFVLGIGVLTGNTSTYPGDFKTFTLNFLALSNSYNGAWWFVATYVQLVLMSPMINRVIQKYDPKIIFVLSFLIYFIAYVQRIKTVISFDNVFLDWMLTQAYLIGTSQLAFVAGGLFAKYKIYTKLQKYFTCIPG